MSTLSSPLTRLRGSYDVLVVGSGYGGAVAASVLARARRPDGTQPSVCVLERGKEIPLGQFPIGDEAAAREFQVSAEGKQVGRQDALYWLHAGRDISVFKGCGLGGTSLVNANVALPPEERVWQSPRWPKALLADLKAGVAAGMAHARRMLGSTPYPTSFPSLKKYEALRASAEKLGAADRVYHPPINVTFESKRNHAGIEQPACDGCGDCVSGCNLGAKNTLMMNYLPDAKNHGAEIFCQVRVSHIARTDAGWRVYFQPVGALRERFTTDELFVDGKLVILSAGALGSAEILLRSKRRGLSCSDRVGDFFSGNGDVLGFAYNTDREINGIGAPTRDVDEKEPAGPCISGIIDRRDAAELEKAYVIEEGVIPGAIAKLLPEPMRLVAELTGDDTDAGFWDKIKETARDWSSALPGGAYRGAIKNTQTFLVMSHDSADGQLRLEGNDLCVSWPGVGDKPHFKYLHAQLREATAALGGTYVPSPMFNRAFGYGLITVHPLGGCAMAEHAGLGATNHKGQVFSATAGESAYESFYVSDGSVLPCSVGVNPLLTIAAIAERNVRLLAAERNWTIDDQTAAGPVRFDGKPDRAPGTHLQFTERMAGYCSTRVLEPGGYVAAATDGQRSASPCHFVLTIGSSEVSRLIEDPTHPAEIVGTVYAPALSAEPMTVSEGLFNLFVRDDTDPKLERMRYRMRLRSVEGKTFYFDGFKLIRNDPGFDVWDDTTTLYVSIHGGLDESAPRVAQGVLRITKEDFAVQLTTMEAHDADGKPAPAEVLRFGELFARDLWHVYGIAPS